MVRLRDRGTAGRGGKLHGEGAALAWGALDRHPAAVRDDDPLDQAQAEPGALDLRGNDVSGTIERLEDPRLIGGLDPDAAIGDGDADHAAAARPRGDEGPGQPRAHLDRSPGGAVLDGVVDEVLERAPQRWFIAEHRWQIGGDVELDDQPRAFDQPGRGRDDVVQQRPDTDRPEREASLAGLDAGKLEDLLDHVGQPAALGAHQLAVAADLRLVVHDAVSQVLGGRSDHGERRAQLVRDGGHELHLLLGQPLRAPGREHQQAHAGAEQAEHARADEQIAASLRADRSLE